MVYFCNIFLFLHTLLKWWWWCLFINTNDDLDFSLDGFGCLPAFTKSFQKIQLESKWNMAFWVVTAENFREQPTTWNGCPVFPDWIFQMEIHVPFLQNYLRYQFLVSQLFFGNWNWFIKGLVNRLSHDFHFDIDCNVSTALCRSSSGNSVDLLSRTICITVVVSDWCILNLACGWWVSIQRIVGIIRGGNWSLSGLLL